MFHSTSAVVGLLGLVAVFADGGGERGCGVRAGGCGDGQERSAPSDPVAGARDEDPQEQEERVQINQLERGGEEVRALLHALLGYAAPRSDSLNPDNCWGKFAVVCVVSARPVGAAGFAFISVTAPAFSLSSYGVIHI